MRTMQRLESAYKNLIELSKKDGNAAVARRDIYLAMEEIKSQPVKTVDVYGIKMSSIEEMRFAKWRQENNVAMNTKKADERLAITLEWLENYLKQQ